MSEELKPCPFCGRKPLFVERQLPVHGYKVQCSNIISCGGQIEFFDTVQEAIDAWNKRTMQTQYIAVELDGLKSKTVG